MEEKKEKKKLNKKPLLICLAIALVFAIIGIVDIKSNAAEVTTYIASITEGDICYKTDGSTYLDGGTYSLSSDSPLYAFWYREHELPVYGSATGHWFVISKSPIDGYKDASVSVAVNGETWHLIGRRVTYPSVDRVFTFTGSGMTVKRLSTYYGNVRDLIADYMSGNLDVVIDYSTLPVDDEMPVVSNLVRSYIINHYSSPGEEGITQPSDTYEYLTWVNTSDLPIQIEVVPVVQYYKTLFGKSEYLEEYVGDWRNYELLESGISKYLRQTDDASLLEKYNEDYQFKEACLSERKVNIFSETAYFFYGYRVRYVDVKNEKAGPWMVVMPSEIVNESEKWLEYSNGAIGNSSNCTGEISDTNYGDVDKNLEEIDETIKFKDKYEIVDGDVDTQEATNWLYSVVNFIKGTPQVVGSVLGFLPQPILYGMYVTIFLGVIASGLAIIKALF